VEKGGLHKQKHWESKGEGGSPLGGEGGDSPPCEKGIILRSFFNKEIDCREGDTLLSGEKDDILDELAYGKTFETAEPERGCILLFIRRERGNETDHYWIKGEGRFLKVAREGGDN